MQKINNDPTVYKHLKFSWLLEELDKKKCVNDI